MSRRIIRTPLYETDPMRFVTLLDDFHAGSTEDGEIGDLGWLGVSMSGSGGAALNTIPTTTGGFGVRGLRGNANSDYCVTRTAEAQSFAEMSVGMRFGFRVLPEGTSDTRFWAGFASNSSSVPIQGNATKFLGVRYDSAIDGNVYVVSKNGSGSGSEDVLSLGAATTTAYKTYWFDRVNATTLRCYSGGALVGTLTTSNFPATGSTCQPVMGIGSTTGGSAKDLNVDFIFAHIPMDRS
tara:strand:- start:1354 stop:2067 length:714 start_codon:yes stop_codon:yes gene_type:complete